MSRIAKNPLPIPASVEVDVTSPNVVKVKGAKGVLERRTALGVDIAVKKEEKLVSFTPRKDFLHADVIAGTERALVRNMLRGVAQGYDKKLALVGVGYRAQVQGKVLNLQVGFSHPIKFQIPAGISIETPSQTEIVVRGIDKQLVGQVAAQIRAYRPPEPYKGKGIRYDGEKIVQKEGKKK